MELATLRSSRILLQSGQHSCFPRITLTISRIGHQNLVRSVTTRWGRNQNGLHFVTVTFWGCSGSPVRVGAAVFDSPNLDRIVIEGASGSDDWGSGQAVADVDLGAVVEVVNRHRLSAAEAHAHRDRVQDRSEQIH
jgi:hypothetical protein